MLNRETILLGFLIILIISSLVLSIISFNKCNKCDNFGDETDIKFIYDNDNSRKTMPLPLKLIPGCRKGRAHTETGFEDPFGNELTFNWTFDLGNMPKKYAIITTAYLVFPNDSSKYYCDMGFDCKLTNNAHCMEIDLIEITNNSCIQCTYHDCKTNCSQGGCNPSQYSQCGQNGCPTTDIMNKLSSTLKCTAQLKKDGTFGMKINNQTINIKNPNIDALKTIKETSSKNPAVFVVSAWTNTGTGNPWWPGIGDNCKSYTNPSPEDAEKYPVKISNFSVSSNTGTVTKTSFKKHDYVDKCDPSPSPGPHKNCPNRDKCNCDWTGGGANCGTSDGSCCWNFCCNK